VAGTLLAHPPPRPLASAIGLQHHLDLERNGERPTGPNTIVLCSAGVDLFSIVAQSAHQAGVEQEATRNASARGWEISAALS
jgi:hypothetical protein